MRKIVIDLEGSDNGSEVLFDGVLKAAEQFPELQFILASADPEMLERKRTEYSVPIPADRFEVLKAEDVIRTDEPAMSIFKGRDNSSMAMALDTLKENETAIGLLSAGNTGALMVGSIFRLGLNEGLKTPALSTCLPNTKGRMTVLVDCGANINLEAKNLKDFALLGSDFATRMFKINKPTVALLNVGREEGKGSPLYVEAYTLLNELGANGEINFIGNAEGYDVISGYADVIVCDGFAGNIILKLTEAVGKCALSLVEQKLSEQIRTSATANTIPTDAANPLFDSGKPALEANLTEIANKLKELFVFNERGGATFLGTKKPVIKMHGCATSETVVSCVEQLIRYYE